MPAGHGFAARLRTWSLGVSVAWAAGCSPAQDAPRLYVASGFSDQVFVLDSETGAVRDTLALDPRRGEVDEPHGVAVAPDGQHWYATVSHGEPTLWKYETLEDRLVGRVTLPTRGAARIRLTPDGRRAFVPDYYRSGQGALSSVAVVDLETLTVTEVVTPCSAPHDAAVDPSGRWVAVACSLSDELVILDARTLSEAWRRAVGTEPGPPGQPRYRPLNVAWHPDGESLYVALHLSAEIVRLDTSGKELARGSTGRGPAQIAMSEQGLVVANRGDASVSLLDPLDLHEVARIPVEATHPHGLTVDARGAFAYVSSEGVVGEPGAIGKVDLAARRLLWNHPLGSFLVGVALEPS